MNLQPVNPMFPVFYVHCARCNHEAMSTNIAADLDAPAGTFLCFACMGDAARERVRLAVNAAMAEESTRNPHRVAQYRKAMGFTMPRRVQYENPDDPSWAGCRRE